MAAPKIFKNPDHQALFDKQGFLVVPSFLVKEEVKYMDNLFDALHPDLPSNGFFAGVYSSDLDYKKRVSEEVKKVYHRAYESIFENYTPFGGAFLHKISAPDSDLFVHQDWTVVEEEEHVALNIWVPLCDITKENGPLMVLPGSQYDAFNVLRAPTMRFFFDNDSKAVIDQLEVCIVKAGDAVILNQSLVHYSPPNVSGKIRKAITAGVKTKDAQMIFHFKEPQSNNSQIEKFEMEDDFFIHFENFFEDIYKRPTVGKSVGFMDYSVPMFMDDELKNLIRKMKTNAGYTYFETAKEPEIKPSSENEHSPLPLWKIYSPFNILNEIKLRMKR